MEDTMATPITRLVRDVIRTSNSADPKIIAEQIVGLVPAGSVGEAFREILAEYVRVAVTRARVGSAVVAPQGMREHAAGTSTSRASMVRTGWRRALRDRVHVAAGTFKFLADCTADDLTFAEGELSEMAARTAAKAEFYGTLRKLLEHHDVERVEELPGDVLADFLTGAAA